MFIIFYILWLTATLKFDGLKLTKPEISLATLQVEIY